MIQLYTHPLFFRFFSHTDYHRILGRVLCAIQQIPIYLSVHLLPNLVLNGQMNEPLSGNGKVARCSDSLDKRVISTFPGEPPRPAKFLTKGEGNLEDSRRRKRSIHCILKTSCRDRSSSLSL